MLRQCDICPRKCGVNRIKGEIGFCKASAELEVAYIGLHFGEEPPISGERGSGTIFFAHCNLNCVYCQNWQISQPSGKDKFPIMTSEQLAKEILILQEKGAHNINLVSPTQYVPQIIESLYYAKQRGLNIPVVYNTNGYDSVETLKLLDGIIDIYLPDIKYSDNKKGQKYSFVKDYVKYNRLAIEEMYNQVGNLVMDKNGIAQKGILIRHLILPNNISGSKDCLGFLSTISKNLTISLMSQYSPQHGATRHPALNRGITKNEYEEIQNYALDLGLKNCFVQELESRGEYLPDFRKKNPFQE